MVSRVKDRVLWRGDFQEARQMLTALGKRADRRKRDRELQPQLRNRPGRSIPSLPASQVATGPHAQRVVDPAQRRLLDSVAGAPDIRQACAEAFGPAETASVTSLRALLGVIGAHEWRTKGIEIPRQAAEFIRTSVSSRRSAVSTWTSSRRRLCPPRALQQALPSI